MLRTWSVSIAALVAVAAFAPASAGAAPATYCVHLTTACPAGSVDEQGDLQAALTAAANGGGGTVDVGPGHYLPSGGNSGFSYRAGSPVTIAGAGIGSTYLDGPGGGAPVLLLDGPSSATVSQLTARGSGNGPDFQVSNTTLDHISAEAAPGMAIHDAVDLIGGSTLTNSTVTLDPTGNDVGVSASRSSNEIDDSTVTAGAALVASGATTVKRSKLAGGSQVAVDESTSLNIANSLLLATGTSATGILATDISGQATVNATYVTLVATAPTTFDYGVDAEAHTNGHLAEIDLNGTIVSGFLGDSLFASQSPGDTALVTAVESTWDGPTYGVTATPIPGPPTFVDAANGDYRLRWDSPLIDQAQDFLTGSTDLDGNPRIVTTHAGSGSHNVDLGAYEYQHRTPAAVATATPATVATGQAVSFDGSQSSDPDHGDTLTYAWAFDDGGQATGAQPAHAFATPGSHQATLTVTDPTGLTATATVAVAVVAPAAAPTGPPQAQAPTTGQSPSGPTPELELIGSPKVTAKGVVFTFTCISATCSGSAALGMGELVRMPGSHVVNVFAARHTTKPRVTRRHTTVGSVSFTVAAGRTVTVTVPLSSVGRRLLARFGRLPVTLTVDLSSGGSLHPVRSQSVTIKPAKRPRHR